jgi:hypothetical protein
MEPDDFARFVEYAYRYDYTAPSWVLDERTAESDDTDGIAHNVEDEPPPSPPPPEVEPEPAIDTAPVEWGGETEPQPEISDDDFFNPYLGLSKKMRKFKAGRAKSVEATPALRQSFHDRIYLTPQEPKTTMLDRFLPTENSAPEQDFTAVFLAHARLYTFACMRLIDPLKRLALHKLHQTLLKFSNYDRRVGDVVELARYAYDHGEDRKADGTIEDLRKLVVEYIALEVSNIGGHESFATLLQEGGEFVVDYWRIIAKEELIL